MPLLPIDRGPITQLRQALAAAQPRLDAARVDAALARAQLAQAQAQGDAEHRVQSLKDAVVQAEQALKAATRSRQELIDGIRDASRRLFAGDDFADAVQALQGDVPIALLPVRLETRYLDDGQRLAIRIYPDTVHVMRHVRGLTDAERRGGQEYWAAVAQGEGGQEAVWRRMVSAYRAPRAQFIVQASDPAHAANGVDEAQAVSSLSRQTCALLLPDRFCAVGYAAGRREVFRVWADHSVPDILPMAPELDPALASKAEADGALFGKDREWMFDFDAAVAVGMAIQVTPDHVRRRLAQRNDALPFAFGSPLERLVVLGVDWTLGPDGAADALEDLLEAHAHSHGMAFVPLGTATNNTGRGASALNSGSVPPLPDAAAPAPTAGTTDAYDLLQRALGFKGQTLLPGLLPGAGLAEQRTQMHMINALWRGTFGRYLGELWNVPIVDTEYVTDHAVDVARRFAVNWVRPGGPLPLLRIGKQPYGVLPVVAGLQPQDEAEVGVGKVLAFLRPTWQASLAGVPRVDGGQLADVRELIQSGPWSVVSQFRNIENPHKAVKVNGIFDHYGGVQTDVKGAGVYNLLKAFGVKQEVQVLMQTVVHDVQAHDLGYVPWVQADPKDSKKPRAPNDVLDPPYIRQIHAALGQGKQAKALLSGHQNGDSLLEALLAFSAEEEFDHSGLRLVDQVLKQGPHAAAYASMALSRATPAFVAIAPPSAPSAFIEVAHSRTLASLQIPAVTGGLTVEAHVSASVAGAAAFDAAQSGDSVASSFVQYADLFPVTWRNLGSIQASLDHLAPLTVGELDTAFRLTLDTFSYRLDAWATGLASKRLDAVRSARAQADQGAGLHIGAYGFVEDLRRDTQGDSLGYTHAPSLTQAAAAAMLRSGFLANADRGGEAFNIDLSSARVQKARSLIEGVERGQTPAALLGYRFERGLRDTQDFVGAKYILDYRLQYPMRPAGLVPADQPQERIAARDVVDGLALVDAWRRGDAAVLAGVAPAERPAVKAVLDELLQTWDAVSDVMVSESVYQLAQNNLERSAAAAAMLDAHASPVAPQVTQTARSGVSYAQRLVLMCSGEYGFEAWQAAAADDPHSRIEPRLDAWLAGQLGDPARFAFRALKMRNGALDGEVVLTPTDLQRGALSLVLGVAAQADDGSAMNTPLRRWLVRAFERAVPAEPGLALDILQRNADGQPGLAEFEALAATLHTLVAGVRALTRHDLVVPQDGIEATQPADQGEYAGVDAAEITPRGEAALALLAAARAALEAAADDDEALTAALLACWPLVLREAEPEPLPANPSAERLAMWQRDHRERRNRVLLEIKERQAAAQRLLPTEPAPGPVQDPPLPPVLRAPTRAESIGIAIDRIKLAFGKHFPVLTVFTLGPYAASVAASLADQEALVGADPFAIAGWLPQLGRVREGADRLDAAVTAHEALHEDSLAGTLAVWQLPHKAGRAWAARPEAWVLPPPGPDDTRPPSIRDLVPQVAVVAAGADALAGLAEDTPLAGLQIDEWQEVIPDRLQTTGVAFHYDAPGARPPQALLLAVPPQMAMASWSFDQVLATVHEAFDLAQLRCVRPKDLVNGLGAFLPGNFLPQNFGAEVPSVELWQMARKYAAGIAKTVALGKI